MAWELPAFLSGSRLADALSAIWATWRQTRPDNLFAALRALDNASMTRNVLRRIPAATVADPAWLEAFNGYIDDVSRDAGRLGRTDCLAWLTTLAPIIATLGGDEALAEVVDAIDDAGTLWP